MKVEGKDVEALTWLKETGERNRPKRVATPAVPESTGKQQQSAMADVLSTLKLQTRSAIADQLTGGKAVSTSIELLSQLSSERSLSTRKRAPAPDANGNAVLFNGGKSNTASVTGRNNSIDFHAIASTVRKNSVAVSGEGNQVRGYNGGQTGNSMNVEGNQNRVYAGENTSGSTVNVSGNGNTVNLGAEASNNDVAVTGSNNKVTIGSQGLNSGSNQNWKIQIKGENVEVKIFNGKVDLKMNEDVKNNYEVSIDEIKKSIEVTLMNIQII